ncbi:MAG: hypothetical protein ACK5LN_09760 [Propioniciclava sp.]
MAQRAHATIVVGESCHDVAVLRGTTVAGLLSMLEVDSRDLVVTLADGQRADPASVVGGDLPSGAVLTVSRMGTIDPTSAGAVAPARTNAEPIALAVVALGLTLPVLAHYGGLPSLPVPGWARWWFAGLALLLAGGLLLRLRHRTAAWVPALLPAVVAVPFAAAVPLNSTQPAAWALLAGCGGTLVAAFGWWLWRPDAAARIALSVWGAVAGLGALAVSLGWDAAGVSPLGLAGGVLLVALAPLQAGRLPEHELVDVPLLTTTAARLRAVGSPTPSVISQRWVRRHLGQSAACLTVLSLVGTVVSAAAGLVMPLPDSWGSWRSYVWLVTVSSALGVLTLSPRQNPVRLVRIVPRVAAALMVASLATRSLSMLPVSWAAAGGLLVVGGVVALGAVIVMREPCSARPGRLADLVQSWSLALVIPASFVTSGLFQRVWEWGG